VTYRFRPWGPLRWVLQRLPAQRWSLVGTLGAEDRALGVAAELLSLNRLCDCFMLRVVDADIPENRFYTKIERRINRAAASLVQSTRSGGHAAPAITRLPLLCDEEKIIEFAQHVASNCSPDIVLDVSTMPKRFFFPLLTVLQEARRLQNIVVTYTVPEQYGEVLAEDPEPWRPLPMYGSVVTDPRTARIIVGVGYQPLQLHTILDGVRFHSLNVKLLLPFPSIPPGFMRNWAFVRHATRDLQELGGEAIVRVHTHNTSLAFDHLSALAAEPDLAIVLAPFGPKPISLAMCLYGAARRSAGQPIQIGYTQPRIYSDSYSTGIASRDGIPVVHAYCVRLSGNTLYQL
jgi:hypothetical protein